MSISLDARCAPGDIRTYKQLVPIVDSKSAESCQPDCTGNCMPRASKPSRSITSGSSDTVSSLSSSDCFEHQTASASCVSRCRGPRRRLPPASTTSHSPDIDSPCKRATHEWRSCHLRSVVAAECAGCPHQKSLLLNCARITHHVSSSRRWSHHLQRQASLRSQRSPSVHPSQRGQLSVPVHVPCSGWVGAALSASSAASSSAASSEASSDSPHPMNLHRSSSFFGLFLPFFLIDLKGPRVFNIIRAAAPRQAPALSS